METNKGGEEEVKGTAYKFVCKAASLPPDTAQYLTNMSKMAYEGKLGKVVGRENEIAQLAECLGRKTKSSPCLIGPAGVGKTAIVEALAQLIEDGKAPLRLQDAQIFNVDFTRLISGYSYELPKRVGSFIAPFKGRKDIILFFDEIHLMFGGALETMKPAMARGEISCIGATTEAEYKQTIASDAALDRRMLPIRINEVSMEVAYYWIRESIQPYEDHHGVVFENDAIRLAVKLSQRHIRNRFLPDKAIDVLDQAGSRVRMQHGEGYREAMGLERRRKAILEELPKAQWSNKTDLVTQLEEEAEDVQNQIEAFQAAKTYKGPVTVIKDDIIDVVSEMTRQPISKLEKEARELQKQIQSSDAEAQWTATQDKPVDSPTKPETMSVSKQEKKGAQCCIIS